MTKRLIAVVLLVLVSSSAIAQQGFYLGVGGGRGDVTTKDILVAVPQGTAKAILDAGETSYKLIAGYRFGPYFAIEGTYQDFQDPDPFSTGIDDENGDEILGNIETSSLQIAALASLSLADGAFDIYGRLGVSVVDEKLQFSGFPPPMAVPQDLINIDQDANSPLLSYGIGAQLNLGASKNIFIRAEWEQTQSEIADRYDYLGLSLGFKFGG